MVLIGFGKDDEQKSQAIINLARANNIVNFVGKTSLMQTARIIKLAKAVIGGDTGNLHLAAALNILQLCLWGRQILIENGPYRQMENVILAGHECDGCWRRTCAKNIDCLASIKPNQVIEKLKRIELLKDE